MIKPDTIIACTAFILFVITCVSCFLRLNSRNPQLPLSFFGLLMTTCFMWSLHGYMASDVALYFGAGFGGITTAFVLCFRIYGNLKLKSVTTSM